MARKNRMIADFAGYRRKQLESDRFELIRAKARFKDPHALELDVPLLSDAGGGSPVDTMTLFAGTWSNVKVSGVRAGRGRTGQLALLEGWFEADVYTGVRLRLGGHVTTSLRYNLYTSPSDAFRSIHEVDWRVAVNDAAFWGGGDLALFPALRVARELDDGGGPEGWYFQPSLTPTWRFPDLALPLTVQVPLVLGFGADGQYRGLDGFDRGFGFFQTGLAASVDLDVLPDGGGTLTLSLAIDHVILSDAALDLAGQTTRTLMRTGVSYAF